MLAGITLKKKPHVGAETGMGTPFPAALGAPSLPSCSAATCQRQKVAAGAISANRTFFDCLRQAASLPTSYQVG